ncbi:MAG: zinc-binding dehydrogenase [Chromatiales bacterium]|jgi:threonine dehydrogenase-like Zn-dependent dehydrogenase|nr:zinc-binding dehydrogenase [Chromatiales bacterium]
MRAAIARAGGIVVDELPEPEPAIGQVLVKSLACGICGSDLHALRHGEALVALSRRAGAGFDYDPTSDVVFGHEFCAEVLDYGPRTDGSFPVGTRVVSIPRVPTESGAHIVGYSNRYHGACAEHFLLGAQHLLEVPNGLSAQLAALTEPMAVGAHAVARAEVSQNHVCVVIGCGPVGLAVIAALRAAGHAPIIAADYSAARRDLAEQMGADIVVDAANASPYVHWKDYAVPQGRLEHARLIAQGVQMRPSVIFECVGMPGVIQAILDGAPSSARVVVVGVCMQSDTFEPSLGIMKEIDLRFVLGYTPGEYAASLRAIAEGHIDVAPLVTDVVDLYGVARAFEVLADPVGDAKVIVVP